MKLLPILIIFVAVAMFITIIPNIFGGFETEHDMEGSDYEPEYNAMTTIVQANMSVLMAIGTMLVLGFLFIVVKLFI